MTIGSIAAGYPAFRPGSASVDKAPSSPVEGSGAAANVAFYPSPIYQVDLLAKITVTEFRDPSTGTITNQYPSAKVVEQYRRQRDAGIAQTGDTAKSGSGASTGTGTKTGTGGTAGTGVSTSSAVGTTPATAPSTSNVVSGVQPVPVHTVSASSGSGRVSLHA